MTALGLIDASARIDGRRVLDNARFAVRSGEVVAVVGPNGAGKSSAVRALVGLLSLDKGQALLGGDEIRTMTTRQRARRVAYLPQERRITWNLPASEVAALGAPFLSGGAALTRAHTALDRLEIGHLADRGVAEMSGGERARVLLARALVSEADALAADEPLAGLDPDAQLLVAEVLRDKARQGDAVLLTCHDLTLAAGLADRIIVMDHGAVVADAAPAQALSVDVLRSTFNLDAHWVCDSGMSLLAARRR
ncbi:MULTISPECIES: ABC transporter ATP-binding protein [unclassified Brevundimonas]|uniref:ABC transporter ATP-binding protein n=1 Tax=unclassified Brevundimonas TaxID=2622653 RepID=UPI001FD769C6|nr:MULTISPECIES: ABC transporter ATP-binding protein [unclassified Brevundimonas]